MAWTADHLRSMRLQYLIGAHCTGIEAVYQLRARLGLPRGAAVVGAVGATFVLGEGIHAGVLAK
jgi:7,8-dihydropterin-6-yl-methyl-4-(beta-D-ribofuranosyl)aminobenzene 5'-phosphate synthase